MCALSSWVWSLPVVFSWKPVNNALLWTIRPQNKGAHPLFDLFLSYNWSHHEPTVRVHMQHNRGEVSGKHYAKLKNWRHAAAGWPTAFGRGGDDTADTRETQHTDPACTNGVVERRSVVLPFAWEEEGTGDVILTQTKPEIILSCIFFPAFFSPTNSPSFSDHKEAEVLKGVGDSVSVWLVVSIAAPFSQWAFSQSCKYVYDRCQTRL